MVTFRKYFGERTSKIEYWVRCRVREGRMVVLFIRCVRTVWERTENPVLDYVKSGAPHGGTL